METIKDEIGHEEYGRDNPIWVTIKNRTAYLHEEYHKKANTYYENNFEPKNVEPITFSMFKRLIEHGYWSFRQMLESADKTFPKFSANDEKILAPKNIGNLIGDKGPMSVVHLERLSDPPPNMPPTPETLKELEDEVKNMPDKPVSKISPDPDINLKIVIWTMLKNIAHLMHDIHEYAVKNPKEVDP